MQSEYFQDDLFPPTKVLWEPTMTAEEWINGMETSPPRISLKPPSMKSRELSFRYKLSFSGIRT